MDSAANLLNTINETLEHSDFYNLKDQIIEVITKLQKQREQSLEVLKAADKRYKAAVEILGICNETLMQQAFIYDMAKLLEVEVKNLK